MVKLLILIPIAMMVIAMGGLTAWWFFRVEPCYQLEVIVCTQNDLNGVALPPFDVHNRPLWNRIEARYTVIEVRLLKRGELVYRGSSWEDCYRKSCFLGIEP